MNMYRTIIRITQLMLIGAVVTACTTESELRAFTSDGCSLFPDSSLISEKDWCSCCFEHDLAYWRGGTAAERENTDALLKDCVAEKSGNETLAIMMHEGVRLGGSPYFYNWYRWGYGWGYERKYKALTPAEVETADSLVEKYFATNEIPACPI
jgi:hypothetical protein